MTAIQKRQLGWQHHFDTLFVPMSWINHDDATANEHLEFPKIKQRLYIKHLRKYKSEELRLVIPIIISKINSYFQLILIQDLTHIISKGVWFS